VRVIGLLEEALWSWWIGGMAYLRSSLCITSDAIIDIYLVGGHSIRPQTVRLPS